MVTTVTKGLISFRSKFKNQAQKKIQILSVTTMYIHSTVIHPSLQLKLSICCVAGSVLGARGTAVDKTKP